MNTAIYQPMFEFLAENLFAAPKTSEAILSVAQYGYTDTDMNTHNIELGALAETASVSLDESLTVKQLTRQLIESHQSWRTMKQPKITPNGLNRDGEILVDVSGTFTPNQLRLVADTIEK